MSERLSAGEAIRAARDVVVELTGKQVEGISGINRSDGGWAVSLDVVELARIPSSTDLIATYEVCLDDDGGLVDMERRRRYTRNQTDEE
ncbi:MAG TPA: gas vesicle protein [Actinomycetota bacterium]|nr:gas vesicle protein [Actinomycetota bacterium]